MKKIVVLGAGPSGYGAARKFKDERINFQLFEKKSHIGGHCSSYSFKEGFIFDDGPHISFTNDERIKDIFAKNTEQQYEQFSAKTNNFWKGIKIKHPAQVNLYNVSAELKKEILLELIEIKENSAGDVNNYEDWLYASYGKTFANEFPMKYTRKFHTTEARNLTTDWVGPRLYQPNIEEVIHGMLFPNTENVHYIKSFRYPTYGGFVTFLNELGRSNNLNLNNELTSISLKNRELTFNNKDAKKFDYIVSSLPLNEIVGLIEDAPRDITEAAKKLAWTKCIIVNIGINRSNISDAHWTYIYDEDLFSTRLSFPHMFSPKVVPEGCGSIQTEIYFSDKYKPLNKRPQEFIEIVYKELIQLGLVDKNDKKLIANAWLSPYAQVIYDHDRNESVNLIHQFLLENDIHFVGRYGEWAYTWSDDGFKSGEKAAESILSKLQ